MNKKKTNSKKSKKSNLDNLNLADGMVHEDPDIKKIKELESILGVQTVNPFGTKNLKIFEDNLKEMTLIDMQRMCEKIGIFASGSRQELKKKLLREFKASNRGASAMSVESPAFVLDPENPEHQKIKKILGEI